MAEALKNRTSFITEMEEDEILERAKQIISQRFMGRFKKEPLSNKSMAMEYLTLHLAAEPAEQFMAIFMDTRHRVLDVRTLFRGTVNACSVHPREVLRECMNLNASAVILAHNHPSGDTDPSHADHKITERLQEALGLVDTRVLDHLIVGGEGVYSFAEHGLL